jgi:outer membrane protein
MKRFFTSLSVIAIILLALSWTNTSGGTSANAKKIAVYNIDSILVKMPEYDSVVSSQVKFQKELDDQIILMEAAYQQKISDFNRDSSKFSPAISMLKKRELTDIHARIQEFREAAAEELDKRNNILLAPLKEKINAAASESGKSNGYMAVIITEGYIPTLTYFNYEIGMPVYNDTTRKLIKPVPVKPTPVLVNQELSNPITYLDPKITTVNITKEIMTKLGLKP